MFFTKIRRLLCPVIPTRIRLISVRFWPVAIGGSFRFIRGYVARALRGDEQRNGHKGDNITIDNGRT